MLLLVALIPASAAIATPAAVGVSVCIALESHARQVRRAAEPAPSRPDASDDAPVWPDVHASVPLPINGVGAPRWRPLAEIRAGLLNIPPPMAIA
jgi:hypothetical protein